MPLPFPLSPLGTDVRHPLPYDAEVEYLESTGKEYLLVINGTVDSTIGLFAEYSMTKVADNYPAGFSTTNSKRFLAPGARSGQGVWAYGWGTISTGNTRPNYSLSLYPDGLDNFYSVKMNFCNDKSISFGGSQPVLMSSYGETFSNTNFLLFKSYSSPCIARFRFAKISRGSEIIADLIPVRFTNENGVSEGAMYDKISGQLFRNAGTGVFIVGPDKE